MADKQKHRFRDAIDWARRGHWLWTLFPASWKAFFAVAVVASIAAVLSRIRNTPLPLFFLYLLCAVVIYAVGWLVVRRLATPPITAKFIRTHLLPSSWALPMTMDIMQQLGRGDQQFTFDLLYEIYLVNSGPDITVKNVRAEAEVEGQPWTRLDWVRDLGDYQLKIEKKQSGSSGNPIIKTTRTNLVSLMDKIEGGLKMCIGCRGWLRFRLNATKKQVDGTVHTKLWIVDALGNEHPVVTAEKHELEPSEGEITYSRSHYES
jgi:hypothetical protein